MKKFALASIICILAACVEAQVSKKELYNAVEKFISYPATERLPPMDHIDIGAIDGCFLDEEFWSIYLHLKFKYPQFISEMEVFGKTFQGRNMQGFWLETQAPLGKVQIFLIDDSRGSGPKKCSDVHCAPPRKRVHWTEHDRANIHRQIAIIGAKRS